MSTSLTVAVAVAVGTYVIVRAIIAFVDANRARRVQRAEESQ